MAGGGRGRDRGPRSGGEPRVITVESGLEIEESRGHKGELTSLSSLANLLGGGDPTPPEETPTTPPETPAADTPPPAETPDPEATEPQGEAPPEPGDSDSPSEPAPPEQSPPAPTDSADDSPTGD